MEKNRKEEDVIIEAEVVPQRLSIPELARRLEAGIINPATRSKRELRGCALYFKSLKYENDEIAVILNITIRSVERYIKKIKDENASLLGLSFQKKLMTDIMKGWTARDQRLLRLSYAPDISSDKRAKILFMRHKVDMNIMALLEKLGYLRRGVDLPEDTDSYKGMGYLGGVYEFFTDEQKKLIHKATDMDYSTYTSDPKYGARVTELIKKFVEENKNRLKNSYDQQRKNLLKEKYVNTCVSDIYSNVVIKKPTETTALTT